MFVNSKAPAITAWLETNAGMKPDRRTVYNHKGHIAHPKDKLVSQVAAQRAQGTLPAKASEEEYLDAVLAAAMQVVIDNPDSVTIEHGLKAASARMAAKASRQGQTISLTLALTKPLETTPTLLVGDGSIDGEYSEV